MEKRPGGLLSTLSGKIWAGIACVSFLIAATLLFLLGFYFPSDSIPEPEPQFIALAFSAFLSLILFLASLIALLVLFLRIRKKLQAVPFRTELVAETTSDATKGEAWVEDERAEDGFVGVIPSTNPTYAYYFRFVLFAYGTLFFVWSALSIYMTVWAIFAFLGGDIVFPVFIIVLATILLLFVIYGVFFHPLLLQKATKHSVACEVKFYQDHIVHYQVDKKGEEHRKMRILAYYDDITEYKYKGDALFLRSRWGKKPLVIAISLEAADEAMRRFLEESFPKKKRK